MYNNKYIVFLIFIKVLYEKSVVLVYNYERSKLINKINNLFQKMGFLQRSFLTHKIITQPLTP
ncbi:hypothetical protein DJ41_3772 [Acinetobacter baumannii ATCC 19606 = CIP 70.34 = JCM 6841]|uniref:Uncharacterized protein n=1 Tax=Acinetobacter baumannii (strain ATCC 19606 / DSM 30007 / JCM 6841 / CCUG 19606 / CIP 70.34 / NBRC 109757 / NCIMB 12457 / NCTC 12156 / 81) TaxID=575584 RepID=A0ABX6CB22_ACIB2|nr:hypothetical protein DJ41_3772 [Acinetobacter baumannii ATCC 19606 = CIP 70.34 = JCM 6841]QFQ03454.1 hypothetical protein FQU82_p100014 [Acinetobacter baumannii]